MVVCEGDVVDRVPVFGGQLQDEREEQQRVDDGDDGAAVGDREGAILRHVNLAFAT